MAKIRFPLKLRMKGPEVEDLQTALQVLLNRSLLLRDDEETRQKLLIGLQAERAKKTFGSTTRKLVSIFQKEQFLDVTGAVDEQTADALNRLLDEQSETRERPLEFLVKGNVRFFDGFPAAGLKISAFDRDLRREQALGESKTDRQGSYQIQYSSRQFRKAEKDNADLVIKAFATDGSLLAVSSVLFNAPPVAVLDLTIPADVLLTPTLFEKIKQALEPLLEGLKVEQLEEDGKHQDLSFLSGETGFEKSVLARFALGHRLKKQQGDLPAEFWFVLLGGSFYQFAENQNLEEQLLTILAALPSLDATAVSKALTRGFNEKEIPESFRERIADWIEAFLKLIARLLVKDEVSEGVKPSLVKLALEDAGITTAARQETFARLFNEHQAFTPELLDALEKDSAFKKKEIEDLRTSFQLSDLTRGDFSVVKMLKTEFNIRQPEKIRTLAKRSEDEWVRLVRDRHASGDIALPIEVGSIAGQTKLAEAEVYGKMLERQFREAFPTTAFAGGLERALQNGGARGLRHARDMRRFLERHETFELLNTPVEDFLKNSTHPDFQALANDEIFKLEVKATQRVFKLAPTFEATDALLADGLHSAQKIYRLGKTEFVRRYSNLPGFTADTARLAWNRAADTHAAVLTIVADLKALEADALPRVLKNNNEVISDFPNWNNLFKTGDLCECEHCNSVLGPAAYFADLLMFLGDRDTNTGHGKVKDVLFSRRPDLGFLELNCANALTPLPYIDVVCEVLEDAVDDADENDLELTGFTAVPPGPAAAEAAVAQAFEDAFLDDVNESTEKIGLGADFSLSQVSATDPDRWVVHGDDATYLLKKKGVPSFFAEILRNTKTSADELRAYPQYVNPKAYEKLREAKYPLTLPFDLFAEEIRAAFQKCNLQRWDLMRVMRSADEPNDPTEGEIAAEYFGISASTPSAEADEKRLILVADPTVPGQQEIWGEEGNAWLSAVGNVKRFLQKTGLEYNELLALLDLRFINPASDITIHHLDASCDTDQKVIQLLNPAKLDRIHRFLRLWRKLKDWKMWELDLVIRHPGIGNQSVNDEWLLNEAFLVNLFYFSRLKNRLGGRTTVEQLCALFGDLNPETRFTKLHEKREDALYQNLFLNRRLINPLDPAFHIGPDGLPEGETISDPAHLPVILAALGIREADLTVLHGLTRASNGERYITDDLTLDNLSFLWRHAWLSNLLKFSAEEWKILLEVSQQDLLQFASPQTAWNFVERIDHLKIVGFTPDELGWLLAADRSTKAAVKETDAARFLAALRKELHDIKAEYDPNQYRFLTASPPTDVNSLTTLLTSLLQKLNRDEATAQFFIATLSDEISQEIIVPGLPAVFSFPATITSTIRIRYDEPATALHFTGLMTAAQRTRLLTDASLAAVTGIAAYQEAIEEFFTMPRLALKFFEPVFTAPLVNLPKEVDFKTLADPALTLKISYDTEQRLLRYFGILSAKDKAALDGLSADAAYRNAVNSLATQPRLIAPPDERIWLLDTDLNFPLRDLNTPANDHLAENLAMAVTRALAYLSKTLSEKAVVQQSGTQLGLTEAIARYLLTNYARLPDTLLAHLTGAFASSAGVVDYATLKTTFDGWFWASRVAVMLNKWKIALTDLEKLAALTDAAQLLDFLTLPLDDSGAIASIDRFIRTGRLLHVRDGLPETGITFLEVLEKLHGGGYAAEAVGNPPVTEQELFAADVALLNEAWPAADVAALTVTLDLDFPADYLLAENWERIRRAFYFLGNLNAGAGIVQTFAAAAMTPGHAKTLKELLRSKFGVETWLILSAEIQDTLRERKRDALAAYLLAGPPPADVVPSGKWENTNDLYAYYLLDIEMSSCQLTSRLVQGSGSIQLFVQRCFMGLEPQVKVNADDAGSDSSWRWWKWMSKYRVREANYKVWLWPENWIEPELKKDRSPFFKDLENELLQNEINQYTVETAYTNYLDKLEGVAQLEIAGFYQEDDGDETIIHVFGRTKGAEPHLYYYRRYDYRQWTPWEKVDLDIQGNYLIPAVVNKRLFLFWPVFTEVPDEIENNKPVPIPEPGDPDAPLTPTSKKLKLEMAVSDYRQGKWTPKKISTDFVKSRGTFTVDIVRKHYQFLAIDRSEIDGSFGIGYRGSSLGSDGNYGHAELRGSFGISGCKGVPESESHLRFFTNGAIDFSSSVPIIRPDPLSTGILSAFQKWRELGLLDEFGKSTARQDGNEDDFALLRTIPGQFLGIPDQLSLRPVLKYTSGIFKITPPWHLSYFDKLWLNGSLVRPFPFISFENRIPVLVGIWLPFFYNDRNRTFFVLPSFWPSTSRNSFTAGGGLLTSADYPKLKQVAREMENAFEEQVHTWLENNFPTTPLQRRQWEEFLRQQFPQDAPPLLEDTPPLGDAPPSYADEQIKDFARRWFMRFFHYYLAELSLLFFQFQTLRLHFKNFYHPFVCDFAKLVYNPLKGIPALMSRETQLKNTGFNFRQTYQPTELVVQPWTEEYYPKEDVDFTSDGAYSSYNWELFFHAPLLIANSLSKNQRFEEARDWYHFIFNPIGMDLPSGGSPMSRYWITKRFFETTDPEYIQQRIDNILRMLAGDTNVPGFSIQAKEELEAQVLDWRKNAFEPHRIANYRTVAYQKTVVMKYLDNLIAWGDNLFRQDSMESINEATQMYVLAAEILGPQPKKIPPQAKPSLESFNELEGQFDKFSNALVEGENLVPPLPGNSPDGADPAPLPMLYFCIPQNEKLLGYWETVADRLYKIRHCMNIEGVVRQLALFEPPIDPGALVKAVAGGMDIGSALADLNAPLPFYRFNVLLQKANEVCNDVKALGGALLAALEKKDAEALSLLRQNQEIKLLEAVKALREKQIEEAKENLEGVKKSKVIVEARRDYYRDIEKIIEGEQLCLDKQEAAFNHQNRAQGITVAGSMLGYIPNLTIGISGFGGSPEIGAQWGTGNIISALQAAAGSETQLSNAASAEAGRTSTLAGYDRRFNDWKLQEKLADKELEQIEKSIAAADLRKTIAEKELENHILQIENAKATDAFMRSKYTNQELYQWQVGEISSIYFQSYRLAYDLAKRAERCFRFELGLQDSSYISFGYWDSLKKGLLAGEKLQYDLRRLETAYLEQNRREFELTKHVSLLLLDPRALVKLRETGRCFIDLPEEIFDLDYPGHYFRRIKSVSITLPCVAGPYTTVSCTLRLLKNSIRINTNTVDGYPRNTADDERFVENNIPVKAIAASNAQNDSGIFELSFRDERYLPFEGAGVVSEWSLELFNDSEEDFGKPLRQFDYGTISDVILHIKYTAREDAGPFKNAAISHLRDYFQQEEGTASLRMFDLRQEFPTEWHRFLHPIDPANGNVFELKMSPERFRILDQEKTLVVNTIWLLARTREGNYTVSMTPPLPETDTMALAPVPAYGGLHFSEKDVAIEIAPTAPPVTWLLKMTNPAGENLEVDPAEVEDLLLIVAYTWNAP